MIVIAGGGVGGLRVVLMFHAQGIPCRIFEAGHRQSMAWWR